MPPPSAVAPPSRRRQPTPTHSHKMTSCSTLRSEFMNGSMSFSSPLFYPFFLGTAAAHKHSWRKGRRRRGGRWGIGERTGQKPSPFPYLRRRRSSWGKAKDWGKKPSPFPHSMQMGCGGHVLTNGTRPTQRNDAWLDGTWPRHGPPLQHAGHEKQGATAHRRPSASLSRTWKGPTMGSPSRRDQRAS